MKLAILGASGAIGKHLVTRALAAGHDVGAVRPAGPGDGPATGKIVVSQKRVGQARIARADVAAWMLQTVAQPSMPQSAVLTTTGAG
jgi:putative NADH-flavin reductase